LLSDANSQRRRSQCKQDSYVPPWLYQPYLEKVLFQSYLLLDDCKPAAQNHAAQNNEPYTVVSIGNAEVPPVEVLVEREGPPTPF